MKLRFKRFSYSKCIQKFDVIVFRKTRINEYICMKIRVISEAKILRYVERNVQARSSFIIFLSRIKVCDWSSINDLMYDFPNARLLVDCENKRVIFKIGGNKYRMICDYNFYKSCCLYVAFIGTHSEYDKVDACRVNTI